MNYLEDKMDDIPKMQPIKTRPVKLDFGAWDGPDPASDPQMEHAEYVRWQMVKAAQDVLAHCPLTKAEREAAELAISLFDWVAPVQNITDSPPF